MKAHPGPLHPTTRCTAPGMEPRRGTPVASYVAGPAPDARPLERGQPRDADTEGGNQPADKSLINRRLKRSTPGPVQAHSSTSTPATTSEQPNRELTSSSLTGVIRASWLYPDREYDLLIAKTRQRDDLVLKSPGIGRMSVKDAYSWNAPC